ncbi:hypothetical protein DFO55_102364 [Grimontella sp. AG753]|nr:hypothetical protein DFO55_102364 [Grimontella sp. AG753]
MREAKTIIQDINKIRINWVAQNLRLNQSISPKSKYGFLFFNLPNMPYVAA